MVPLRSRRIKTEKSIILKTKSLSFFFCKYFHTQMLHFGGRKKNEKVFCISNCRYRKEKLKRSHDTFDTFAIVYFLRIGYIVRILCQTKRHSFHFAPILLCGFLHIYGIFHSHFKQQS